jgi:dTDP-4-amino-4,6-dideoxygalactose transaminase
LGSKIKNNLAGSYGDSAMFSFCQNKVITTGEGGIIVTDDKKIYEKLVMFRSHGRSINSDYFSSTGSDEYVSLGYNFRMPSILAALGVSQMKKINKIFKMRQNIANVYYKELKNINSIKLPSVPKYFFHIYQMYTLQINQGKNVRDSLINHLSNAGISTKIYFNPIHLSKFYKNNFGYRKGDLPTTEQISDSVVSLPIYPTLKKEEVEFITGKINEFFEAKK